MEIVPYGGWNRCARYAFAGLELVITLDVGPRVIRFGFEGSPNELKEYEKHLGLKGGDEYRSYGGHRLWIGPEDPVRTMQPDNGPVETAQVAPYDLFRSATDQFGIQKEIGIEIDADSASVLLRHRLYNRGPEPARVTPWSITVMREGGECIFPLAPFQTHAQNLLPVRPLVLWGYTRLDDPRYRLGPGVIRLRQDASGGNQKIGMPVSQGYAAYANSGHVFLKRFDFDQGASYPDLGCNFETFTREDMLEIESLGPLVELAPGSNIDHFETWYLLDNERPPDGEKTSEWLADLANRHPHRRPLVG
jgi:hypothetical protein